MVVRNYGGQSIINFYYNFLNSDNFFIKATTYSSLNHSFYSIIGTSYQYVSTDITGKRSPQAGLQYYQTAYSPLQLPYGFMGIGRSNNYIEHLTIYVPYCQSAKSYTPIVPNSQIKVSSSSNTR